MSDGDRPAGERGAFVDAPITVQVSDADLYLEQVGPQNAPIVFYLHGGPGYNAFSFRDLVGDELLDYRMLYADQRGSGRSYQEGGFDLDTLADDVDVLLRATRLERASLLAHGFGALIAIRTAVRHPGRVARVVLVNPWLSMPLLARTVQRRAASLTDHMDEALPPESALGEPDALDPETLTEQAFGWLPPKQLFDALEFPNPASRMRLEHSDAVAQFGPQETAMPADAWSLSVLGELPNVRAPVVALFGTLDGTSWPAQAEAALERLPNATTGLVEAGHYPWLDDPETFLPLLREALGPGAPAAPEQRPD